MDCVTCGTDAGYNRAVIDTVADRQVGGFCLSCERREFGASLQRGDWPDACCALCRRDGYYALPTWTPRAADADADVPCAVAYDVTAETIRLCDEHFHDLSTADVADADESAPSDSRDSTAD